MNIFTQTESKLVKTKPLKIHEIDRQIKFTEDGLADEMNSLVDAQHANYIEAVEFMQKQITKTQLTLNNLNLLRDANQA